MTPMHASVDLRQPRARMGAVAQQLLPYRVQGMQLRFLWMECGKPCPIWVLCIPLLLADVRCTISQRVGRCPVHVAPFALSLSEYCCMTHVPVPHASCNNISHVPSTDMRGGQSFFQYSILGQTICDRYIAAAIAHGPPPVACTHS